ncbi:MAG: hypothetical protein IPI49_25380 [Myxococcales bacterium]|nr:hypothetical protein [Myxococcales bacterium]
MAAHLRRAGYDALVVRGKRSGAHRAGHPRRRGALRGRRQAVGQEIPQAFDSPALYGGKRDVGVSAIGPAGEKQLRIASVMNDRYHAFGRQGFGAIYGAKNLKAIVIGGTGEVPVARPAELRAVCKRITDEYKRDLGLIQRISCTWPSPRATWPDVPADDPAGRQDHRAHRVHAAALVAARHHRGGRAVGGERRRAHQELAGRRRATSRWPRRR